MMKTVSRTLITAAAASMAFAPIAVQANTRAGDSAPVYTTTAAQPGLARSAEGEDMKGASSVLLLIFAAAAAIAGIIVISGGDDGQSPGT